MNKRKLHVMDIAHHLFIEKGFQATSIQEILESSRISKGTFYNYFSSKSELLIEIIKWLHEKLEDERSSMLIGADLKDKSVFCRQVVIQMKNNKRNKLLNLYREIFASKDAELVRFIKHRQVMEIRWLMKRFSDICGEDKKPYLLDCAIMFLGIIHQNIQYNRLDEDTENDNIERVIEYSVNRILYMVEEVSLHEAQLLDPAIINKWLPTHSKEEIEFSERIELLHAQLQNIIHNSHFDTEEKDRLTELIEFIKEELLEVKKVRHFVIESALKSISTNEVISQNVYFQRYMDIVRHNIH
ncbi:TetR/AcrR family transcriptional regulator [Cytobacillus gottheilii]|uniref:TetR/AcrR family transcriptional regulator n=1 Tax=Cytobacillus gottheilii TaxID=859144 RepID=UPI001594C463|nr:TetR/AcrR family transcriptional regulator [Cytobacillus gottheilii]